MIREFSLHVVGAAFPNKDGSNRRFEILLCVPGEPVRLVPEPRNPADPNAVAVMSARDVQIGYLSAERAGWVGRMIRQGQPIHAVFQQVTAAGAAIRLGVGRSPRLPEQADEAKDAGERDFWPDDLPIDE